MPQAPTPALSARLDFVRRRLLELELEAIVVTALPNILYLTNFSGSSAIVVVTAERILFLTDSRYVAAVGATRGTTYECPRMETIEVEGSYDARLAEVLAGQSSGQTAVRRIGFEAAHLTVSRLTWLERAVEGRIALVPTTGTHPALTNPRRQRLVEGFTVDGMARLIPRLRGPWPHWAVHEKAVGIILDQCKIVLSAERHKTSFLAVGP